MSLDFEAIHGIRLRIQKHARYSRRLNACSGQLIKAGSFVAANGLPKLRTNSMKPSYASNAQTALAPRPHKVPRRDSYPSLPTSPQPKPNASCAELLDRAIIVIDSPRSGMTLLGNLLATHPHLAHLEKPWLTWKYGNHEAQKVA
jgi:hypothetical protein